MPKTPTSAKRLPDLITDKRPHPQEPPVATDRASRPLPSSLPLLALLTACTSRLVGVACPCDGHGVQRCDGDACGPCMCLPFAEPSPDPTFATTFWVDAGADGDGTSSSPWGTVNWSAVDTALVGGDVAVWFSARDGAAAEVYDDRLDVLRADTGPHRVVLDGRFWWRDGDTWRENETLVRARFRGAGTSMEPIARHRVTLRGFELAHSSAQGVYWVGGDGVVLEDLDVHHNGRSPAILFEYANRSGLPSTGIVLRNTHVHEVRGECVYIGGAEGTGGPSHAGLLIERNLVHGCGSLGIRGHQWDAINVKDGIEGVEVVGNVLFDAHWGLEIGSPADLHDNLVFDVADDGIHLGDEWGDGHDGTAIRDIAVLGAGGQGVRVGADFAAADDVAIDGLVVIGAAGDDLRFAGEQGITGTARRLWLLGETPVEGWGTVDVVFSECAVAGEAIGWVEACDVVDPEIPDLGAPAGVDGVFFTADDPWRVGPLAP